VAGFETGSKLGGWARLAPPSAGRPWEVVVSGVRENAGGEASREYVSLAAQLRSGRLWLYERAEIDLNRGWRAEQADGTQVSDLRLLASWRHSPTRSLTVSYDRHRDFQTALTRQLAPERFDPTARQGLRATIDLWSAESWGFRAGGAVRLEEGAERQARSAFAGARHPDVFGLVVSADATYYTNAFTRGVMGTARAGRRLAGHQVDVSYTVNRYELQPLAGSRTSQWIRISGYARLGAHAFALADVERSFGDDFRGTRVGVDAGYRF
jgi:hypothetical protein